MHRSLRYDHYKVLGVPRDASLRTIKQAYRLRVKQWHPDHNAAPNAPEVFHALHDAYSTLIDADRRADYDDRLRFYKQATEQAPQREHSARPQRTHGVERDRPVNRLAFFGLHLTGLLFGVALVGGILVGVGFLGWPGYALFFCAPGLAVIPDSISGLRLK